MEGEYELKTNVIGSEKGDCKELKVVNRIIRVTDLGLEYEADIRHGERLVKQLGLEHSKPVDTPGVGEFTGNDDLEELNKEYSSAYRSIVARANYLAVDRPDIQFAVKVLAGQMAAPRNCDWTRLKRPGRLSLIHI